MAKRKSGTAPGAKQGSAQAETVPAPVTASSAHASASAAAPAMAASTPAPPTPPPAPSPTPTSPTAAPTGRPTKTLIKPAAPAACLAAFRNGLPCYLSGRDAGTVAREAHVGGTPSIPSLADIGIVDGPNPGSPHFLMTLQAFALSLADAANGTRVVSPVSVGWKFFAGNAQRSSAIVGRLVQRPPAQVWKLVAVHYGDLVAETLNAIVTSPNLNAPPPQVQGEDYELRMLAIHGMNTEVFWLMAHKAGLPDFVIPVSSAPLQPGISSASTEPVEMANYLASIQAQATSLLTMNPPHGA